MADNAATADGARWRLFEVVLAYGFPADAINAGYEWYGYHQPCPIVGRAGAGSDFWIYLLGNRKICATVRLVPPGVSTGDKVILAESSGHTLIGASYRFIAVARRGDSRLEGVGQPT